MPVRHYITVDGAKVYVDIADVRTEFECRQCGMSIDPEELVTVTVTRHAAGRPAHVVTVDCHASCADTAAPAAVALSRAGATT